MHRFLLPVAGMQVPERIEIKNYMANNPDLYFSKAEREAHKIGSAHAKAHEFTANEKDKQTVELKKMWQAVKAKSDMNRINLEWAMQPNDPKSRERKINLLKEKGLLDRDLPFKVLDAERSKFI